ncbi:hypothetical protein [Bradyrhizobium valentinum]|nr:hypothetical protein [Bradyrhizobium valentinum]
MTSFKLARMMWETKDGGDDTWLIQNGPLVVGSIRRAPGEGTYRVEIMWGGPTGDIIFEAPTMTTALAFVAGVEKAFEAMQGTRISP